MFRLVHSFLTTSLLLCNALIGVHSFSPYNAPLSHARPSNTLGKLQVATTFGDYSSLLGGNEETDNNEGKISPIRPPDLAGRWFQLETQEQGDTSTFLEVFLNPDGTIESGQSDCPNFVNLEGLWKQKKGNGEPNQLIMSLTFAFEQLSKGLGEVSFNVQRTYQGECIWVGAKRAAEGKIFDQTTSYGDAEVGFFSMIDTTDEIEKRCLDSY